MSGPTWKERLRYKFDNFMSQGTIALIGGLGVLSLIVIVVAALVIVAMDIRPEGATERLGFFEAAWESLMRSLDAGTMGGDAGWSFRMIMFLVTLGGVFVISTLIGVLTSGIETKMDELRKGRSQVIESGHTVILGWAPQIFSLISELVIANANQPKACIVILGEKDKVEMEEEIKANLGDTGRTRIVCRMGSPVDLGDLDLVSLPTSRSVIVLSPEKENPDADALRTILAVLHKRGQRTGPFHVVAEIRDSKNIEVARLIGKDEVELVLVGDLIARITAQTCRQSGLSVVYRELLDFGGDEIYFKFEPGLTGKTFGEALLAYEDSALIGLYYKDGSLKLNPSMDTQIGEGDRIVVISEDDDTIRLSGLTNLDIQESAIQARLVAVPPVEHILILGWNVSAPVIIRELDSYVAPDSMITVLANNDQAEAEIMRCCESLANLKVEFQFGDTTDRQMLERLGLGGYNYVIVLAYPEPEADSVTLVTLLHLRDIADRGGHQFAIVSEMQDVRNRALAEVTRADDFIVSDELVSLMLSQVSENKHLNAVFADLFDPDGSEVYLKSAADYVALGIPVNFYTVVEAARRRSEVAFGYRCKAQAGQAANSFGVVVNPDKSDTITFVDGDRIILLAEE